jgi:3,4-dihydroxy 2-butanone 4-phosphate synthase
VDGLDAPAARKAFGASFRAPGHVILLNGSEGGLARRQGHTELSLELARQAGLVPSTTICEMLDPATGRALAKNEAAAYAERNGLVFLTGQDVLDAWQAHPQQATPAAAPRRVPTSAS